MNAQKESLKKASGVHTSSHKPTKKCAMKMKESSNKEKNDACVKMLLMEGGTPVEKQDDRLQRTSGR